MGRHIEFPASFDEMGFGSSNAVAPRVLWPLSVVSGDSESSGFVATSWVTYIQQLSGSSHPQWVNQSVPARTIAQINAAYAAQVAPFAPKTTGVAAALFIWAGTGDMFVDGTSGADTFALLQTFLNAGNADGFTTITYTCLPRFNEAAFNTQQAIYNGLMKGATGLYRMLYDAAAAFPDPSTYFDGVHLTAAQESSLATQVNTLIKSTFSWQ